MPQQIARRYHADDIAGRVSDRQLANAETPDATDGAIDVGTFGQRLQRSRYDCPDRDIEPPFRVTVDGAQ